jgi:hypothetical protein
MRILGIELRRSDASWLAAFVVALGVITVYLGQPRGWWTVLAVHQRDMLGLLWPLTLAAGAWQARRDRRARMEELLSTTPRPRRQRIVPLAVAMALAAVVGYLTISVTGAALLRPVTDYFPAAYPAMVAVGTLSMVAAAWLGLAVGRRLPYPLTPPILALVAVVVVLVLPELLIGPGGDSPGVLLLAPPVSTTRNAAEEFLTATGRAYLIQVAWLAALAATGLAAFAANSRLGRALAAVPLILGAAVVVPALPQNLSNVIGYDQRAIAEVCTPDAPAVCVTKVHEATLAHLRGPARQALAALAAKLPAAPTTVVEDHGQPQRADTLLVPLAFNRDGSLRPDADDLLWELLSGAGTRPCLGSGPDPRTDRYLSARWAVAAWLLGRPVPEQSPPLAAEILQRLNASPADEQRARAAAFRTAELACTGPAALDALEGSR